MSLVAQRVHAAGIDPAIVKVEQRADRDRVINLLVSPTGLMQRLHIAGGNAWRVLIDLIDEPKQQLFLIAQSGAFQIPDYSLHQVFVSQQFRRDRGVRLQSKRTLILRRGVRRNQLAKSRSQRAGLSHDLLREPRQMAGRLWLEGEHMPDLRIFRPCRLHRANTVLIRAWPRTVFDVG
jgi:hypothetical protein